jgi:hypothetical protein
MVCGSTEPRTRKDEGSWSSTLPSGPRRITQWSTANYPAVYSKLSHKTICGGVTCSKDDEEDEVMAEKTKKSSIAAQINTS